MSAWRGAACISRWGKFWGAARPEPALSCAARDGVLERRWFEVSVAWSVRGRFSQETGAEQVGSEGGGGRLEGLGRTQEGASRRPLFH